MVRANLYHPTIRQLNIAVTEYTTVVIANLLKGRWKLSPENLEQLSLFRVPINAEHINASNVTNYSDCEANTLHNTIDIQDNEFGFTTTSLQGKTNVEA